MHAPWSEPGRKLTRCWGPCHDLRILFKSHTRYWRISDAPGRICVWTENERQMLLYQLGVIAQSIPGNLGERIQKVVQFARRPG
jgi:hypothetical protein